jgi:hypothetical protein
MAQEVEPNLPWIMCSQSDTPPGIIPSPNGYYADYWIPGFKKKHPDLPAIWTEDWAGWFQAWGTVLDEFRVSFRAKFLFSSFDQIPSRGPRHSGLFFEAKLHTVRNCVGGCTVPRVLQK